MSGADGPESPSRTGGSGIGTGDCANRRSYGAELHGPHCGNGQRMANGISAYRARRMGGNGEPRIACNLVNWRGAGNCPATSACGSVG